MLPLCTWIGALLTIVWVWGVVKKIGRFYVTHFVLAGVMINAFFSSMTLLILFLSDSRLRGMMIWLMGDLGHTQAQLLIWLYPIAALLIGLIYKRSQDLNKLALGDDYAQSLGIPVKRIRTELFILSSSLPAIAISAGGIIGFIGLVIPHCLRMLKQHRFEYLMPASLLLGGSFLILCDLISKQLLTDSELPVGVLTSLLGAPFFLWLLIREGKK
jgi:iron complex transport system permease protein